MGNLVRIYCAENGIWRAEFERDDGMLRWTSLHTRDEKEAERRARHYTNSPLIGDEVPAANGRAERMLEALAELIEAARKLAANIKRGNELLGLLPNEIQRGVLEALARYDAEQERVEALTNEIKNFTTYLEQQQEKK